MTHSPWVREQADLAGGDRADRTSAKLGHGRSGRSTFRLRVRMTSPAQRRQTDSIQKRELAYD